MIEFIFMLTRDDVTLSDAREVYASLSARPLVAAVAAVLEPVA